MWLAYMLLMLITGKITGFLPAAALLLPLVFLFLAGFLLVLLSETRFFRPLPCAAAFLALVGLDQSVKGLVHTFLGENSVSLLGGLLRLKIARNPSNAAFSFLDIKVPPASVLIGKAAVLLLIAGLFFRIFQKYAGSRYLMPTAVLLAAGAVSSFFDSLFWGYSLDFINIPPFCTADIKDIYIDLGLGALLLTAKANGWLSSKKKTPPVENP